MRRQIKVTLPANLDRNDICYFKNRHYYLHTLKVIELEYIIITDNGICLTDKGVIKESIHGYRDKITIYTMSATLDLLNNPTYQINDLNTYLIIHSPLFSYYHWFTESIPRLLMIKEQLKDLTLLLPVSLKKVEFVQASLKPFSFKSIICIPKHTNIKVKNLVLPQIKPYFNSYHPEVVNEIRNLNTDYSKINTVNLENFVGRVFLGGEKTISNIYDVRSLLDKYNFRHFELPGIPFYELVQLMDRTKVIVSVDTDELVCINFMRKGTSVLELVKMQTCEIDKPSWRYLNLASSLELIYYYQLCQPFKRNYMKIYPKIKVDLKLLEENINFILKRHTNSVH